MGYRIMNKSMDKFLLLICFLVMNVCVVYFYILSMQEGIKSAKWDKIRCISELTSTKNQLDVVTEYKNKVDKMLADTQKSHNDDKVGYKDPLDTLIGIKQEARICQKQFEELQVECKRAKKSLYDINNKHHKLQDHTSILEQKNEKLQVEVLDLIDRVDALKLENTELNNKLQNQANKDDFSIKTYLDRSFSKQVEESEGVYKIDIHSNADTKALVKVILLFLGYYIIILSVGYRLSTIEKYRKMNSTLREQLLTVD